MSRIFEVLSAVEPGIDGPHAGSDHRRGGAQASQHDRNQPIIRPRQGYPDLDSSNRDAGDWRPQAEKEKYARNSRNQIGQAGH